MKKDYPTHARRPTRQPTATVARVNHFQAYLVVTYEFNATTSTSIMNSIMLPLDVASPMGGTTASDYQRKSRDFWIQEPATITTSASAVNLTERICCKRMRAASASPCAHRMRCSCKPTALKHRSHPLALRTPAMC